MESGLLHDISLYQFKNHRSFRTSVGNACLVLGPNGAGKSNFLESLYLLINGIVPAGRSIEQCVCDATDSAFVRAKIALDSGLAPEFTVTLSRSPAKLGYLIQ